VFLSGEQFVTRVTERTPSLVGWQVRRCYVDRRFGLVLAESAGADASKALLSFNGHVQLTAGSDSEVLDVRDPKESLGPLLGVYERTISACTIAEDGKLVIAFENGWTLRCDPDPGYEAWELRADSECVVCQPGGGISVRQ
jgi:hypothetical protein